jgi:hypothetical protein
MDDDIDSSCSTPFASAPSSPGRPQALGGGGGYFFSAPASPIHHLLLSTSCSASATPSSGVRGCGGDAEFEFGGPGGPMISADELFHNGQIRPLTLPPLPDLDPGSDDDEDCVGGRAPTRGRDLTPRSASVHRRARSMSPLRSASPRLKLINALVVPAPDLGPGPDATGTHGEAAPPVTASSRSSSSSSTSSSSSSGTSSARGSRRWVFIRDMLLHRSKSEPGSGAHAHDAPGAPAASKPERAWPFSSPSWVTRDRLAARLRPSRAPPATENACGPGGEDGRPRGQGRGRGRSRRRRSTTVAAAHERLYAAPNRAQAEEMRRRTFLPYRQGLLGCLGFSSRGYGALHGLTKTLNPVFSR